MARVGFAIKDVASRICRDPEDLDRVTRQVRYWTNEGLLQTLQANYRGTGHHRRYDEEVVPLAAMFSELVDNHDLPVKALQKVADSIGEQRDWARHAGQADPWKEAVDGQRQVYALVAYDARRPKGHCVLDPQGLRVPEGYRSAVLIDLTAIFDQIYR